MPIDVFIDLDGVVLRKAKGSLTLAKDYVVAAGLFFEVLPEALQGIQTLRALAGVRASFFSAASALRNHQALEQLQLLPAAVFSDEHLTEHRLSGFEFPLKDLTHPAIAETLPGFDIRRAFIFDDHDYVPDSQRAHLVLVGNPTARNSFPNLLVAAQAFAQALGAAASETAPSEESLVARVQKYLTTGPQTQFLE